MTAPQTDPEKQLRQHRVPIVAMIAILVIVGLGFFWWMADETHDPEMPGESALEQSGDTPPSAAPETPEAAAPPATPSEAAPASPP